MYAECAFCFLIKLKNSRYFYIMKSQFLYLTDQQTKIYLVSSVHSPSPVPARILPVANQAPLKTEGLPRRLFCARLDCQAFSRSQLAGRRPLDIYPRRGYISNGLTTPTMKFSIVPRRRRCSSENNAGRT
jgi:hypothetical protein